MIPQRNISLLANHLAKAGGRRIPVSVLERDNCFAWFLAGLAESDLQQSLAFKGGMEPLPFEDIRRNLEPVYSAIREASAIEFAFDREDRHSHADSHTFYPLYVGPLAAEAGAIR